MAVPQPCERLGLPHQAIVIGGNKLDAIVEPERARSLAVLRERLRTHAEGLDDGWLVATAFYIVEDLYKSYFCDFAWSPGVVDYIAATAGTFTEELTRPGFVLHCADRATAWGDPPGAMISKAGENR